MQASFKKTLNKTGFVSSYIDEFTKDFIDHTKEGNNIILELGAGYGNVSSRAVEFNNKVICNDASELQLRELSESLRDCKNFTSLAAFFPDEVDFAPDAFDVIYSSRMVHLLDPDKLILGIEKIHKWLKRGSKAFIIVDTPYLNFIKSFIPIYEERKYTEDFPGFIENLSDYLDKEYDNLPKSVNFLDVHILEKLFSNSKWKIEKLAYIKRPDFPDYLRMDGRESAGIIVTKL